MMEQNARRGGFHRMARSRSGRGVGLVKVLGISAGVLLLAAGGVWLISGASSGSGGMRQVSSVDLARVERGGFSITTTSMGEMEARNQVEIRSELDARADIVEIVPEGTVVRKGDVLIRLNTDDLQEQIDQQTLEVERSQADVVAAENALQIQLSENESRERAGLLRLELAELALQQWRDGELVKTRANQQLEIEQAERNLRRLEEKFERSRELLAEGFLSQDEHDSDEIAYINAVARLEMAKLDQQTYEEYQYPRDEKTRVSDVEEARADLDRIRAQNRINAAARESSLATTRRQYELKYERLEKLQQQVEMATIRAPTGGLVVYATSVGNRRGDDEPLEVGREVRPNELLILLPDTSQMVASVRVHEALAGRVRPGQVASVRVDAIGSRTFLGRVGSVGVLAESGGWRDPNRREYTVRVMLDYENAEGVLKPSMRAEAEIVLGEVEDTLVVPVQAVFTEGPVKYVCVPRGSRFERVPVKVGRMSDSKAEILAGVDEGTPVLLRMPETGEITGGPWTREQLELAGVAVGEDGRPIPPRDARQERMEMMRQTGQEPEGGQRPGGRPARGTEAAAPSADAGAEQAEPAEAAIAEDSARGAEAVEPPVVEAEETSSR